MIKIIATKPKLDKIVQMRDMAPLEVGELLRRNGGARSGEYVMRTASTQKFEVINLSCPKPSACWTHDATDLPVRLLGKGEKIMLELSN